MLVVSYTFGTNCSMSFLEENPLFSIYVGTLCVQARNMKMVFNISTLGVADAASGSEH